MMSRSQQFFLLLLTAVFAMDAAAQGNGLPLRMQGVDQVSGLSAVTAATGGVVIGSDPSTMFADPSSLTALKALTVSAGSSYRMSEYGQAQQYSPLKYYSNFSLLMEGLTGTISRPAYDTVNHRPSTAADTVQRPFDAIGPNWTHHRNAVAPVEAFAALPFTVAGIRMTAGLGVSEYADLTWYFQNNNVLSPSILTPDPFNRTRPINDADSSSIPVQWYRMTQQRTGSIASYGVTLAAELSEQWSVGIGARVLDGSSDDTEDRLERGRLRFYQNFFRAESVYHHISRTGTSTYSGQEFTVSAAYRTKTIRLGASVRLPSTIDRSFTATQITDTTGAVRTVTISGKDAIALPLIFRGTLTLQLRENLTAGVSYEVRPYASAVYTNASGADSKPWISSNTAHVGMEFTATDWLTLRAGAQERTEVFEPQGNALSGVPVTSGIYSLGAGIHYGDVAFDLAYQYRRMNYVDTWASEVSVNSFAGRSVNASCTVALPW